MRNIYYFTSTPPRGGVPTLGDNGKLQWLSGSLTGDLLPASSLGDAPISGTYYVSHSTQVQQDLEHWASDKGLSLSYEQPKSTFSRLYTVVKQTGLGISFVAVLLLGLALVITDVLNRTYLRSIQLLNGIDPAKINQQQIMRVLRWGGLGVVIGIVLSLLYCLVFIPNAVSINIARSTLPYFVTGLVLMVAATILASIIFAPNVNLIRTRSMPSKLYHRVNLVLQIVAVAICVMASVSATGLGKVALSAYQTQMSTKPMGQSVTVSIKSFDFLDTQEGLKQAEQFFTRPKIAQSTALSLNIGTMIELYAEDLGGYDEIDMANQNFFNLIKLPQSALVPVKWETLPGATAEFLNGQLELWIPKGSNVHKVFSLYALSGNSNYISLDANVGRGGQVKQPNHPLIIVPSIPVSKMNTSGFLLPSMSTGNLVFTDPVSLKDEIYSNPIAVGVGSIDRIADAGLVAAQYFKSQMISYFTAIIVSFILIIVTAWQSAMIWAQSHRKHILISTMSGVTAKTMYQPTMHKALILTLIAALVGASISVVASGYSDILTAVMTGAVMMILFWLVSAKAYASNTKKTFNATIQRKA